MDDFTPEMIEKLKSDKQGIINWLAQGGTRALYKNNGLPPNPYEGLKSSKERREMKRKIIKLGRMLEKVFEDDSITETLLLNLKQFEK